MATSLYITEIFYSIQGEGKLVGIPSVFVRMSGCNLRCVWCDTPYSSWKPEGNNMKLEEVIIAIQKYRTNYVILTGGEPMLQKTVHDLAICLHELGKHITIETAGTVSPQHIYCDLASISPKLSHSNPSIQNTTNLWIKNHEKRRLNINIITEWIQQYPFQLKFVIQEISNDLLEIEEILNKLSVKILPSDILLMVEGIQRQPDHKIQLIVEACLKYGYRMTPRFHLELFGNKRGT